MKKLQNAPLRWGPCEAHCCPRIDEPFRSYISYAAKKTCPETLGDTIDDTTVVLAIAVTASFSTGQVWSVITSDKNEFCHPGLCIWCLVIVTLGDVLLQREVPLTFLENAHEAPASRQVGTQKSSVSSFLKKTPCRKALRDFGCFFDRGRNEQNKKRWQRFEAGTRTPSYCMHSTSRGCHEIHDDFSSRRLNTHLRRICLRILYYNWGHPHTAKFEWCFVWSYGHIGPAEISTEFGAVSRQFFFGMLLELHKSYDGTTSGPKDQLWWYIQESKHPVTTKWSFIVLRTEALFENLQTNAKQTCVECWTRVSNLGSHVSGCSEGHILLT